MPELIPDSEEEQELQPEQVVVQEQAVVQEPAVVQEQAVQEPVVQDPITNKLDGESFKEFIKRTRGLEVPDKALKPKQTKDQRSTQARNAANFRHQKLEGETFETI